MALNKIAVICISFYIDECDLVDLIKNEMPFAKIYIIKGRSDYEMLDFTAYKMFLLDNFKLIRGYEKIIFCNDTLFLKYKKNYYLKAVERELNYFVTNPLPVIVGEIQNFTKSISAISGRLITNYVSTFVFGVNGSGLVLANNFFNNLSSEKIKESEFIFLENARYIASLNPAYKAKSNEVISAKALAIVAERMISDVFIMNGMIVDVHASRLDRIESFLARRFRSLFRDKKLLNKG